jgi:hypothetical protein
MAGMETMPIIAARPMDLKFRFIDDLPNSCLPENEQYLAPGSGCLMHDWCQAANRPENSGLTRLGALITLFGTHHAGALPYAMHHEKACRSLLRSGCFRSGKIINTHGVLLEHLPGYTVYCLL